MVGINLSFGFDELLKEVNEHPFIALQAPIGSVGVVATPCFAMSFFNSCKLVEDMVSYVHVNPVSMLLLFIPVRGQKMNEDGCL